MRISSSNMNVIYQQLYKKYRLARRYATQRTENHPSMVISSPITTNDYDEEHSSLFPVTGPPLDFMNDKNIEQGDLHPELRNSRFNYVHFYFPPFTFHQDLEDRPQTGITLNKFYQLRNLAVGLPHDYPEYFFNEITPKPRIYIQNPNNTAKVLHPEALRTTIPDLHLEQPALTTNDLDITRDRIIDHLAHHASQILPRRGSMAWDFLEEGRLPTTQKEFPDVNYRDNSTDKLADIISNLHRRYHHMLRAPHNESEAVMHSRRPPDLPAFMEHFAQQHKDSNIKTLVTALARDIRGH